jgi:hypothetical protein
VVVFQSIRQRLPSSSPIAVNIRDELIASREALSNLALQVLLGVPETNSILPYEFLNQVDSLMWEPSQDSPVPTVRMEKYAATNASCSYPASGQPMTARLVGVNVRNQMYIPAKRRPFYQNI